MGGSVEPQIQVREAELLACSHSSSVVQLGLRAQGSWVLGKRILNEGR